MLFIQKRRMKTVAKSSQTLQIKLIKPRAGNREKDVAVNRWQRREISAEKPLTAAFRTTWVASLVLSSTVQAQQPKRQAEGARRRKILWPFQRSMILKRLRKFQITKLYHLINQRRMKAGAPHPAELTERQASSLAEANHWVSESQRPQSGPGMQTRQKFRKVWIVH